MSTATPYPASLCHACAFKRDVRTARSHFLLCAEGRPPKYAHQPVRACPFFSAGAGVTAEDGQGAPPGPRLSP